MSVAMRRLVSLVSVLALVASGTASAQVTIHLTTAEQASCDVTTDAKVCGSAPTAPTSSQPGDAEWNRLRRRRGGGGPTPNNFPLSVLPSLPVTGTPFTVSWTVSGATSCAGSAASTEARQR